MAHPVIQRRMHRIVRRSGLRPRRALEVGGYVNDKSLLRSKRIGRAERWCINVVDQPRDTGIHHVVGSANDMHMFKNGFFDLVMSCAVHEHDAKFWLSLAEMKRVLAPGGLMVVCVPGFVRRPGERGESTTTYRVHFSVDYYRFSRRAMREIFFEDMEDVRVTTVLDPPRIIGWGVKPVRTRDRVAAMLRRSARATRRRFGRARRRLLPAAA